MRTPALALLHSLALAAAITFLVVWNWDESAGLGRFVWAIQPKAPIHVGEWIAKERLKGGLVRTDEQSEVAKTIAETAGMYGTSELTGNKIAKDDLSFHLVVRPVEKGSILAVVEVSSNHTAQLRPGMKLAFARTIDKKEEIFPSVKQIRSGKAPPLRLLGITPKANDVTSLVIEVPECAIPMAAALATGQWRPIVLATQ